MEREKKEERGGESKREEEGGKGGAVGGGIMYASAADVRGFQREKMITGRDIAQAFSIPLQGIIKASCLSRGSSIVRSFLNNSNKGDHKVEFSLPGVMLLICRR